MNLFYAVLLLVVGLTSCPGAGNESMVARVDSGVALLNRLYWSPTLNIWLDRPGDDLRAYYEGRLNPPWWSSANAVEMLIDSMHKTGSSQYEATIAALYDSNKDLRQKSPRVIEELKRRNQWSATDEARFQKRRAASETRPVLNNYYTQFRNEYLDDTGWWGITWLKMYGRTKERKYLATAQAIHEHMAKNWRPDKGGGIMWTEVEEKLIPNAITNSLFILLSARLYETTRDEQYLQWATRGLAWFHEQKLYDGTGVVDVPGHIGDYWTYNQGVFIGALSALYQATGRNEYLEEAVTVTRTVLAKAGLTTADGVLLEKLGVSGWDPGLFKGVLARYLGQLRDLLELKKLHPELAREIDRCLGASAGSLLKNAVAGNGEFTVEWHEGAKENKHNFNTQVSGLIALIAVLPERGSH